MNKQSLHPTHESKMILELISLKKKRRDRFTVLKLKTQLFRHPRYLVKLKKQGLVKRYNDIELQTTGK